MGFHAENFITKGEGSKTSLQTKMKERIEELVKILNTASFAYYNDKDEIMSNYEWDQLFDELTALENETGYILPDSPTQTVGAEEIIKDAVREKHEYPALSLAKSKDVAVLQKWAGYRPIWISWKLDGLTLVLTYDNGELIKVLTRGTDGIYGNNITYIKDYIKGFPLRISDKGHLVVRGEATISYPDFERINELIENEDDKYANPRNLVSGTLTLDKSRMKEVRERGVSFNAFTLVHCDKHIVSWGERMEYLKNMGFTTVEHEPTKAEELPSMIEKWTEKLKSGKMNIPVDGLVICYDDTDYAATGSVTGHHATNAGMAFKWPDKSADTILDHIDWSCAACSISPVAVFDPVHLEGTEVKRASLCNITEMKRLGIGANRETSLQVIKSNMIIPKIIKADGNGTSFTIPDKCPVCGAPTEIHVSEKLGTETLHCTNPDCIAKQIRKFTRFASKAGMNIDGLSQETMFKFINKGFIKSFADIYRIPEHESEIVEMPGFGQKSYDNMVAAIDKSKDTTFVQFVYALNIPLVGEGQAKLFAKAYHGDVNAFITDIYKEKDFTFIDGIGEMITNSTLEWGKKNIRPIYYLEHPEEDWLSQLINNLTFEKMEEAGSALEGKTFVITGDVHIFKNRNEFKAYVESQGGKVAGSVSGKTNYLVNNDINSTSSKNTKAKSLGVEIITEDAFVEMFGK